MTKYIIKANRLRDRYQWSPRPVTEVTPTATFHKCYSADTVEEPFVYCCVTEGSTPQSTRTGKTLSRAVRASSLCETHGGPTNPLLSSREGGLAVRRTLSRGIAVGVVMVGASRRPHRCAGA